MAVGPYLYGEDGWPLSGPSDAALTHAAATRLERDLQAALARWSGGDLTAFAEAVACLVRLGRAPPWMLRASDELVERAMAEDEKRARREWDIARARWEALVELRERSRELSESFGDDRGATWEKAREAVSEVLRGTEAAGSAASVKASYDLIEAAGGERATFESYLRERRQRSGLG
jgi:hypothetical protein